MHEQRSIIASGEIRWQQWVNRALFDKQGNLAELQAVGRDITMRKLAIEALSASEDLFRTLSERSMAGIYVVQDGRFCFVNDNAATYAGYSAEELIAKKSDFMVHAEDRQAVKLNARDMLRGVKSSPHEFRIITKQGKVRWVLETVASITFGGRPAILGNSMDITEEKRAQERLQESETRTGRSSRRRARRR
jgi:PAS domain S-box-containing protein